MPHAPVANNPWYHDLPMHWALLRGSAEKTVYENLGSDPNRVRLIGDPSFEAATSKSTIPVSEHRVLYAVSAEDENSLSGDVCLVTDAGCREVVVSMHPRLRGRADLQRLFPKNWAINELPSTYQLMISRPPVAVIQHGSGLGLEALSLGLPVIDICNPGRSPNYHYLNSPLIPSVSTSDQLRNVIAEVDLRPEAKRERRMYANRWVGATGEEAAIMAARAISEIVDSAVPSSVLLDSWGR
jgi:hypothetical protein